jgi:hypothetical protein
MDIFNAHKEDYIELVREIKTKISQVDVTSNAVERSRVLKEIKTSLGEAERIVWPFFFFMRLEYLFFS